MKILVIIVAFAFLIIAATLFYLFSLFTSIKKNGNIEVDKNELEIKYKLRWEAYILIFLAIFFIVGSLFAPLIFTSATEESDFDFMLTGQIGDTIGGLMNPFITLGGVLITGLAFYVQYKANELQRDLFIRSQSDSKVQFQTQINHQIEQHKLQQVESQFYEMLRLHRENINEMQIEGYDFEEFIQKDGEEQKFLKRFEKDTVGRKIFVTMKTELEFILQLYKRTNNNTTLDKTSFKKCYTVFFSGLEEFERKYSEEKDIEFAKLLRLARAQHLNGKIKLTNHERKNFNGLDMNFNYKPFSGHSSRLGHYFRHLYLSVKYLANNKVITAYDDKINYLRLLRAQLSNHEQILLFYNWLSSYGGNWENDTQSFFTDYMMIHNLWWHNLIKDDYISNQVNYLRTKTAEHRTGNMFEID